jgi:hypothetical protein
MMAHNTLPKVSIKFYKAVVQSVLLYNSKMWNLLITILARMERFHICVAYQMAEKHKPKKGPHPGWTYQWSSNILQECSMNTTLHYIDVTWWTSQSTRHAGRVNGRGDCHCDSGGGNRRCAWRIKTRMEPMNKEPWLG